MPYSPYELKNNPMTLPFQKATLLKRYKRFLVDVEIGGTVMTAHCPNSGSMKGLIRAGGMSWLSVSNNPNRKLSHTLEIIETDGTLVGVNTHRTNHIVYEALKDKNIPELSDYAHIEREVTYGSSRLDFLLTEATQQPTYLEVKNVTLKEGDRALFPDAPTLRGTKHLNELMNIKAQGQRAVMLYVVQRNDCQRFSIAKTIDPLYCETLEKAIDCGVEVLAYQCHVTPSHIWLDKPIPLDLDFVR